MATSDLVQPVLVTRSGTHGDTIIAAATASLLAFVTPVMAGGDLSPSWSEWLSGRFTKTVRKVRRDTDIDRAAEWATQNGVQSHTVTVGSSVAIAFEPMRYADFPPVLAKARVDGLDLPPGLRRTPTVRPAFTVELLDHLTTGKGAAQCAHATWMWALPLLEGAPEHVAEWAAQGAPFTVQYVPAVNASDPRYSHVVTDAGLTEVNPGTTTAGVITGE